MSRAKPTLRPFYGDYQAFSTAYPLVPYTYFTTEIPVCQEVSVKFPPKRQKRQRSKTPASIACILKLKPKYRFYSFTSRFPQDIRQNNQKTIEIIGQISQSCIRNAIFIFTSYEDISTLVFNLALNSFSSFHC